MDDTDWIRRNIKQRRCTLFSSLHESIPLCKCLRRREDHPDDCRKKEFDKAWTTDKNTVSTECKTYGSLVVDDREIKFVRMDVQTDMACVKHLLFNVWDLPKPDWILSVIGELDRDDINRKVMLKNHIDMLLETNFAGKQNIWIITEGIQNGVSAVVGEAIKHSGARNITTFGLFAWGFSTPVPHPFVKVGDNRWKINDIHQDVRDVPSELFTHQIFTDDGSFHPETTNKSYQEFKAKLEKHLSESDTENPIPYIIILCGGWSSIIDGVRKAIDTNTPVIIMKGSGGYADVFTRLLDGSRPQSKGQDNETFSWTGTVSDDQLRQRIKQEITKAERKPYKEGERILLQCLQKRELLTVFDTASGQRLLDAVIKALFKSRNASEMIRILDFYMPAKIYSNRGTSSTKFDDKLSPRRDQRFELDRDFKKCDILARFFLQALMIDNGESVEFIIDYAGLPFDDTDDTDDQDVLLKTLGEQIKLSSSEDTTKDFYKALFAWAVSNNKQKCALLFWKKGKNLLMSALQASSKLSQMIKDTENQTEILEQHRSLFEQRAIGLINHCFQEDKERTMLLMERQSMRRRILSDTSSNQFSLALEKVNRKILATDAYKEYIRRVWYGQIRPFEKNVNRSTLKSSKRERFWQVLRAPVVKFSLNLVMYLVFLCLFGYTLVVVLRPVFSPLEGVVGVWWFALLVEEIRQLRSTDVYKDKMDDSEDNSSLRIQEPPIKEKVKTYFQSYWNIMDLVCLITFAFGAILIAVVHVHTSQYAVYDLARLMLTISLVLFTLRLLQYLAITEFLGSVLEMIWQMMKDLLRFLLVLFIFILAQGLGVQALLYPNTPLHPDVLVNIFRYPFWNIFGKIFLDEIEAREARKECTSNEDLYGNDTLNRCPSRLGRYVVPILMGIYVVLTNILLLNIIIARFSHTIQKVHEQAVWIAAWHRARVILEYFIKPPVPPPFNIFYHLVDRIHRCLKRHRKVGNLTEQSESQDTETDIEMLKWERTIAEYYLASQEHVKTNENTPCQRLLEMVEDLRTRQLKLERSTHLSSFNSRK